MILIDYSQVALANILSFKHELKNDDAKSIKNLIRHTVLSTLKYYKKRYSAEYGEMVIAADGRHYWRRDEFKFYKAHRKKAREESDLDWQLIFDTLSEIRDDLVEHFPYKVVHLDKAEADDVIGVLVKYTNDFGNHEQNMIISSDKDFKQLQVYGNVKQFSPMQKKSVVLKQSEYNTFLIEHIVRGDSGDGIPNILSPDDIIMDETARQRPITQKVLQRFFDKGRDGCETDEERRCWDRNEQLVDLNKIPEDLQSQILEQYLNNKPKGDKMSVYNYLIANRCNLLLNEVEEF